jgi:multiple antibiotic resistance protein
MSEFLIAYSTLISIINPFGLAFVFQDMTRGLPAATRHFLSFRVAVYSFCVLMISSTLGSYILSFFGITVPALRIAGGITVALAGWNLLNKPDMPVDEEVPATDMPRASIEAMAFYPITMPLTTGPGSVSAAIALAANRTSDITIPRLFLEMLVVSTVVALTIYVCYRWSAWVSQHIGVAATRIFTRISAFLLLCVGVQIIITGVTEVLRGVAMA